MLRQKLKEGSEGSHSSNHRVENGKSQGEGTLILPPDFFFAAFQKRISKKRDNLKTSSRIESVC